MPDFDIAKEKFCAATATAGGNKTCMITVSRQRMVIALAAARIAVMGNFVWLWRH
jgi:hypothetical protein